MCKNFLTHQKENADLPSFCVMYRNNKFRVVVLAILCKIVNAKETMGRILYTYLVFYSCTLMKIDSFLLFKGPYSNQLEYFFNPCHSFY